MCINFVAPKSWAVFTIKYPLAIESEFMTTSATVLTCTGSSWLLLTNNKISGLFSLIALNAG